jgi:hypothetical protein
MFNVSQVLAKLLVSNILFKHCPPDHGIHPLDRPEGRSTDARPKGVITSYRMTLKSCVLLI